MNIEISWYSILREEAGTDSETVEFAGGTASDLYAFLAPLRGLSLPFPSLRVAVNDVFAEGSTRLAAGDRVVYIAPVGGG